MREGQRAGFTLIEIAIAVFIMLLMLALAVPSLTGVMANRRLQHSLDQMNALVRLAQEKSMAERRPYLIAWDKDRLVLRTESRSKGEDPAPAAVLNLARGDAFLLKLTAALVNDAPAQWIFWPTGTCEPATVTYKGTNGTWSADYSPLTARPNLTVYAAK